MQTPNACHPLGSGEGAQTTVQHLRDFEVQRPQANLVAILLDTRARLIGEILDSHDRIQKIALSSRHSRLIPAGFRSISARRSRFTVWSSLMPFVDKETRIREQGEIGPRKKKIKLPESVIYLAVENIKHVQGT